MPIQPTYPGVYIEELPSAVHTITGVATSITAFIGRALRGPVNVATTIESYADFERIFGGLWLESKLGYAVQDFFLNGGSQASVTRLYSPTQVDLQAAKVTVEQIANTTDSTSPSTPKSLAAAMLAAVENAQTKAARDAASAVANAAEQEANRPSTDSVKNQANAAAQAMSDAVQAVVNAKDNTSPSTAQSLSQAMRTVANTYTADPAKSVADLVAKAAEAAAGKKGAATSDVQSAAQNAADAINKAAQNVVNAKDTTSPSTPQSLVAAMQAVANQSTQDPDKTAATLVASAADTESKYTPSVKSVQGAAQAEADAYTQNLPTTIATLTVGGLPLIAASEGSWGENLRASIDFNNISLDVANALGIPQNQLFNLTVSEDTPSGITERYQCLTVLDTPRRIDRVLAAQSQLVRWGEFDDSGKFIPPPALPVLPPGATSVSDQVTTAELALDDARNMLLRDRSLGKDNTTVSNDRALVTQAQTNVDTLKAQDVVSDGNDLTINEFIGPGTQENKWGLYALEQVDLFNLLCIPPYDPATDNVDPDLISIAAAYCEQRRAMLLVDSPVEWTDANTAKKLFMDTTQDNVGTRSRNAALIFPRIVKPDILKNNQMETYTASGAVAGIFARTDAERGVWKAPAGIDASLVGVSQLTVNLTDAENGLLNPLGINCLRFFPIYGPVVWGSRTLRGADAFADDYKYIPVRRLALFIEESLYRGTQWVVFEPNAEPLWASIRLNVGAFMQNLFRQGAFQGQTPRDAYLVKCDSETTTQNDIDQGIVNILVAFAPVKPAEFVVIQIQQMAGQIQV